MTERKFDLNSAFPTERPLRLTAQTRSGAACYGVVHLWQFCAHVVKMGRKQITITISADLENKLREKHKRLRIKQIQQTGEDLPFSYFLENVIMAGMAQTKD